MLYELASPAFTLAALMVIGGVVFSAKTFFDYKMAQRSNNASYEAEA